jgi:predicted dehydrogenase
MHTVAIMGLGVRGKIHLHGLLQNPEYYKVVGLCDIDVPKMQALAEEYGLTDVPQFTDVEEMLKETRPEIFVFVIFPDMRLNLVELGVKYGVKGISLEKPMAESLQEAKRMVELCEENGIKAVVCHQQKYISQMQSLKRRIEEGEIGRITKVHVECQAWFSQLGTHYVD